MTYQHAPRHGVHEYSCSLCGARWYLSRRNSFLLTACMFFSQIRLQGQFSVFRDFNFDYLWIHVPSSVFFEIRRDRSQDTLRVLWDTSRPQPRHPEGSPTTCGFMYHQASFSCFCNRGTSRPQPRQPWGFFLCLLLQGSSSTSMA